MKNHAHRTMICTSSSQSTCALGTALSWLGDWTGAGGMRAHQGHASDGAPEARTAPAGVDGGREGVTVRVNDTLVQAGVTHGTAGV